MKTPTSTIEIRTPEISSVLLSILSNTLSTDSMVCISIFYIAKGAKGPIIPVGFDYPKRQVVIGSPMLPTDNFDRDMEILLQFYRSIKGRNPDVGL